MTAAARSDADEQAWCWVIRMDADGWSEADEIALQAWLDADPRHPGALLQAEAMWAALGETGAVEIGRPAFVDEDVECDAPARPWFGRRRFLAGSSALVAASVAGAFFVIGRGARYETEVGEIRRVPLADGSTAAINTASRLEVKLAENRREVRLDRGEAWFQVAKDRTRPFIVEAGRIRVEAVGTAFSVRRRDDGADILVTEGVVEAWANGAEGNKVRLAAGQGAFVADNAGIVKSSTTIASVDRALAWRNGKVDFVNEPIAEAAAEFNRYNRRQLVILDPAIGREQFDGVFRTDDPEGFADAVRDSLGVPVDLSDPAAIRIGRAP